MLQEVLLRMSLQATPEQLTLEIGPKVLEMFYDQDVKIKVMAYQLLCSTLHVYPQEMLRNKLLNFFTDQLFATNDQVILSVSRNFGLAYFHL